MDQEIQRSNMEREVRFSFLNPQQIGPESRAKRVQFKSQDYLFHGVQYDSDQQMDSMYLRKSRRFKGRPNSFVRLISESNS